MGPEGSRKGVGSEGVSALGRFGHHFGSVFRIIFVFFQDVFVGALRHTFSLLLEPFWSQVGLENRDKKR